MKFFSISMIVKNSSYFKTFEMKDENYEDYVSETL